jgi:hypothetical protein
MPYAMAFKISAGLRLGSKRAMKFSGEGITDWRNRSLLDVYTGVPDLSKERRTTMTGKYNWRVDVDMELVNLHLDKHCVPLHFESALKVAEWLRFAGKKAKRWAGDGGKVWTSAGNLADAEYNYKYGL